MESWWKRYRVIQTIVVCIHAKENLNYHWRRQHGSDKKPSMEDLIATAVTTVLVFSSHNIILAILSYKTDEVIDHRLEATEVTKPFPHVDGDT